MRVEVRHFAIVRERLGISREHVDLPEGALLRDLLDALAERHGRRLAPLLPHLRFAVGTEFASPARALVEGAQVALIPPVAGGAPTLPPILVTADPLDEPAVIALADSRDGQMGGVCTFTGVVRHHSKGHDVIRLEYEAHEEMATAVMERIAGECQERWPGVIVAIHHRVGVLAPGDLAVVIAAASPHRAEAFAACRHCIERLKEDAPIWKKEVSSSGQEWVGMGP